jgi:hypothetical protein
MKNKKVEEVEKEKADSWEESLGSCFSHHFLSFVSYSPHYLSG